MTKEKLDGLFSVMLSSAIESYGETSEGKLLKEKLEEIYNMSQSMFSQKEMRFANECFESILDIKSSEEQYIYLQGFRDCILFLKHIYLV